MAWTAELLKISVSEANVVAEASFTDGTETITRKIIAHDLTQGRVAQFCQQVIETLEARDIAAAAIQPGPVTLPRDRDPADEMVIAEAEREAFFDKRLALATLEKQVALGIITEADKAVTDARLAVKTAFKSEYATDPRF